MRSRTYLALSAAGLAQTANAWKPIARTGPLSMPAFASGAIHSELPVQHALGHLALTGLAAATGGLSGPKARLGVLFSAASVVGCAALHREAGRSVAVLEDALTEALGRGYQDDITERFHTLEEVALTRRQLLMPTPRTRRRYVQGRDIAYGEAGRRNLLDVWRRADLPTDGRAPVLVQIHGGAWVTGQKEGQAHPLMAHLADRGWVCVTANYRLSPRATWPDQITDVKRVLAWVKEHIGEHGGDPEFVALTGGSAGGHLCSLAALTPGDPAFQIGFEEADTSVQVAVPFYGVYDFTNRDGTSRSDMDDLLARRVFKSSPVTDHGTWDAASPMSRVHAHAPPFFALHGTNDSLAPVEQARSFVRRLRAVSTQPVALAELPHAQHAFDIFRSVRSVHTVFAVERFLAWTRSQHEQRIGALAGAQRAPR